MSDEKKSFSLPLANPEAAAPEQPKTRQERGDIQSEIAREVAENKIVLYMKAYLEQPMCGFSARAAAILSTYGKPIYAVNILEGPENRQGIKDFSDWPTMPQVYVNGEFL